MPKNKFKTGSFFAKIFLLFAFVALIFIFISIAKETYKKNQVQKEIAALQEEAQKINKDNTQIKEKIAYLESPEYQIKEAKDKLGLKSPEENVIIVKPNIGREIKDDSSESKSLETIPEIKELPNYIKWWNYFFKY
jgi:cell division protein FtsL